MFQRRRGMGGKNSFSCGGEQPDPDGPEWPERPLCQSQVDPRQVRAGHDESVK